MMARSPIAVHTCVFFSLSLRNIWMISTLKYREEFINILPLVTVVTALCKTPEIART